MRAGAGAARPEGTCDFAVMRSAGGMEGTLWGGPMTVGGTPHYTAHVTWPRRQAAHVISTQRDGKAGRSDDC